MSVKVAERLYLLSEVNVELSKLPLDSGLVACGLVGELSVYWTLLGTFLTLF